MTIKKTGSESSARLASLAGRAVSKPQSLTLNEIRELGGSVLVQREPPTAPILRRPPQPNWASAIQSLRGKKR